MTGSEREAGLDVDTPTPPDPTTHVHEQWSGHPDGSLTCDGCGQRWTLATPDRSIPERPDVDRMARVLIAEWERVEGPLVGTSYIATFADMARAALGSIPERPDPARQALADELEHKANGGEERVEVSPGLLRHAALYVRAIPERPAEPLRSEDDQ